MPNDYSAFDVQKETLAEQHENIRSEYGVNDISAAPPELVSPEDAIREKYADADDGDKIAIDGGNIFRQMFSGTTDTTMDEQEFMDRVAGRESTWRDSALGGDVASAFVSGAAGMLQGVTDLIRMGGADNDFTQALSEELGGYQARHTRARAVATAKAFETAGVGGKAAVAVGHLASDIVTFLALMKGLSVVAKGFSAVAGLVKGAKASATVGRAAGGLTKGIGIQSGAARTLTSNLAKNSKDALKFATFRFATTPGPPRAEGEPPATAHEIFVEKAKAAAMSFAYRVSPGFSKGVSSSRVKVDLFDFLLNSTVSGSTGQYSAAWEQGMAEADQNGITEPGERILWGATALIPVVGSDAVFSAMTHTLRSDQAKAFKGLPNGLVKDLTERKSNKAQDIVMKEYILENLEGFKRSDAMIGDKRMADMKPEEVATAIDSRSFEENRVLALKAEETRPPNTETEQSDEYIEEIRKGEIEEIQTLVTGLGGVREPAAQRELKEGRFGPNLKAIIDSENERRKAVNAEIKEGETGEDLLPMIDPVYIKEIFGFKEEGVKPPQSKVEVEAEKKADGLQEDLIKAINDGNEDKATDIAAEIQTIYKNAGIRKDRASLGSPKEVYDSWKLEKDIAKASAEKAGADKTAEERSADASVRAEKTAEARDEISKTEFEDGDVEKNSIDFESYKEEYYKKLSQENRNRVSPEDAYRLATGRDAVTVKSGETETMTRDERVADAKENGLLTGDVSELAKTKDGRKMLAEIYGEENVNPYQSAKKVIAEVKAIKGEDGKSVIGKKKKPKVVELKEPKEPKSPVDKELDPDLEAARAGILDSLEAEAKSKDPAVAKSARELVRKLDEGATLKELEKELDTHRAISPEAPPVVKPESPAGGGAPPKADADPKPPMTRKERILNRKQTKRVAARQIAERLTESDKSVGGTGWDASGIVDKALDITGRSAADRRLTDADTEKGIVYRATDNDDAAFVDISIDRVATTGIPKFFLNEDGTLHKDAKMRWVMVTGGRKVYGDPDGSNPRMSKDMMALQVFMKGSEQRKFNVSVVAEEGLGDATYPGVFNKAGALMAPTLGYQASKEYVAFDLAGMNKKMSSAMQAAGVVDYRESALNFGDKKVTKKTSGNASKHPDVISTDTTLVSGKPFSSSERALKHMPKIGATEETHSIIKLGDKEFIIREKTDAKTSDDKGTSGKNPYKKYSTAWARLHNKKEGLAQTHHLVELKDGGWIIRESPRSTESNLRVNVETFKNEDGTEIDPASFANIVWRSGKNSPLKDTYETFFSPDAQKDNSSGDRNAESLLAQVIKDDTFKQARTGNTSLLLQHLLPGHASPKVSKLRAYIKGSINKKAMDAIGEMRGEKAVRSVTTNLRQMDQESRETKVYPKLVSMLNSKEALVLDETIRQDSDVVNDKTSKPYSTRQAAEDGLKNRADVNSETHFIQALGSRVGPYKEKFVIRPFQESREKEVFRELIDTMLSSYGILKSDRDAFLGDNLTARKNTTTYKAAMEGLEILKLQATKEDAIAKLDTLFKQVSVKEDGENVGLSQFIELMKKQPDFEEPGNFKPMSIKFPSTGGTKPEAGPKEIALLTKEFASMPEEKLSKIFSLDRAPSESEVRDAAEVYALQKSLERRKFERDGKTTRGNDRPEDLSKEDAARVAELKAQAEVRIPLLEARLDELSVDERLVWAVDHQIGAFKERASLFAAQRRMVPLIVSMATSKNSPFHKYGSSSFRSEPVVGEARADPQELGRGQSNRERVLTDVVKEYVSENGITEPITAKMVERALLEKKNDPRVKRLVESGQKINKGDVAKETEGNIGDDAKKVLEFFKKDLEETTAKEAGIAKDGIVFLRGKLDDPKPVSNPKLKSYQLSKDAIRHFLKTNNGDPKMLQEALDRRIGRIKDGVYPDYNRSTLTKAQADANKTRIANEAKRLSAYEKLGTKTQEELIKSFEKTLEKNEEIKRITGKGVQLKRRGRFSDFANRVDIEYSEMKAVQSLDKFNAESAQRNLERRTIEAQKASSVSGENVTAGDLSSIYPAQKIGAQFVDITGGTKLQTLDKNNSFDRIIDPNDRGINQELRDSNLFRSDREKMIAITTTMKNQYGFTMEVNEATGQWAVKAPNGAKLFVEPVYEIKKPNGSRVAGELKVGEVDIMRIATLGANKTTISHELAEWGGRNFLLPQETAILQAHYKGTPDKDTYHAWATDMEKPEKVFAMPKKVLSVTIRFMNLFRGMLGIPKIGETDLERRAAELSRLEDQFKSGALFRKPIKQGMGAYSPRALLPTNAQLDKLGPIRVREAYRSLKAQADYYGVKVTVKGDTQRSMRSLIQSKTFIRDIAVARFGKDFEGGTKYVQDLAGAFTSQTSLDSMIRMIALGDKTGIIGETASNWRKARQNTVPEIDSNLRAIVDGSFSREDAKKKYTVSADGKEWTMPGRTLLAVRLLLRDPELKAHVLAGHKMELDVSWKGITRKEDIGFTQRDIDNLPKFSGEDVAVNAGAKFFSTSGDLAAKEYNKLLALANERNEMVYGIRPGSKPIDFTKNYAPIDWRDSETIIGGTEAGAKGLGGSSKFQGREGAPNADSVLKVGIPDEIYMSHSRVMSEMAGSGRETYEVIRTIFGKTNADGTRSAAGLAAALRVAGVKNPDKAVEHWHRSMSLVETGRSPEGNDFTKSKVFKFMKRNQDAIRLSRPTALLKMASSSHIARSFLNDPSNMAKGFTMKMDSQLQAEYNKNSFMVLRARNDNAAIVGDDIGYTANTPLTAGKRTLMQSLRVLPGKADQVAMKTIFKGVALDMLPDGSKLADMNGNAAFWQGVREKSNEIVSRTQPDYAAENRSALQNKRDLFHMAITRYGTQTNKILNLISQRRAEAVAGGYVERQAFSKTISQAVIQNSLLIAGISASSSAWLAIMNAVANDGNTDHLSKDQRERQENWKEEMAKKFGVDFVKSLASPITGADELAAIVESIIYTAKGDSFIGGRVLQGNWFAATGSQMLKVVSAYGVMQRAEKKLEDGGLSAAGYKQVVKTYANSAANLQSGMGEVVGFFTGIPLPGVEQVVRQKPKVRKTKYDEKIAERSRRRESASTPYQYPKKIAKRFVSPLEQLYN